MFLYQHFGDPEHFHKEYGENFSFPRHLHHSFELIVLLSGSMTVEVDDSKYNVTEGDAVIVFPHQMHSLNSEKSRHVLFIFSHDIINSYYSTLNGLEPKCAKLHLPPYVFSLVEELDETAPLVKIKAALYNVLYLIGESTDFIKKEKQGDESLLFRIFDHVDKNFTADCSLRKLSRELGYGETYVSRYFKRMTQMSYIGYVNKYKISKACYLLLNTDKTVLECSLDCGYTSLRSFNRNFKLHTGLTPQNYKKMKRHTKKLVSASAIN